MSTDHRIGAPSAHNWDMVEISDDDFERMVSEVFDALPDDMVRGVENVGIVVENQPLGERPRLFGQYRGHPLTTRGVYGFGELPDRITLYKNNLQEHSADLDVAASAGPHHARARDRSLLRARRCPAPRARLGVERVPHGSSSAACCAVLVRSEASRNCNVWVRNS